VREYRRRRDTTNGRIGRTRNCTAAALCRDRRLRAGQRTRPRCGDTHLGSTAGSNRPRARHSGRCPAWRLRYRRRGLMSIRLSFRGPRLCPCTRTALTSWRLAGYVPHRSKHPAAVRRRTDGGGHRRRWCRLQGCAQRRVAEGGQWCHAGLALRGGADLTSVSTQHR
jgi:hypothetical protein